MTRAKKPLIIYFGMTVFVLLFGIVYTHFGYGVTSPYMSYAFLPLALVTCFHFVLAAFPMIKCPTRYSHMMLAFFSTAITVYLLIKGIFEIAGAYSHYDVMLLYTAIFFGGAFGGCYLSQYLTKHE